MKLGRFSKWSLLSLVGWIPKNKSFFNLNSWVFLHDSDTSYYCENCKIVIIECENEKQNRQGEK